MKQKIRPRHSIIARYRGRIITFDTICCVYVASIRKNSPAQEFMTLEDVYDAIDNVEDWR